MDADDAQAIPLGTQVKVEMPKKSDRAIKFFWGLMTHVGAGIGMDKRALATEMLVRLGRVDAFRFSDGEMHAVPRSIAAMKVGEFRDFLDEAIDLLVSDYLGDMPRDRLLANVARMCGVEWSEIERRSEG
ncbi:hypothetical protein ABLE91_05560 [Aquabacter sp. CN5-332]|uniref:hypothetical protein n=1 Tax=Aquabacter sp. CN5-332 TaxID=3156608 RepID=UPI0032B43992